MRNAKLIMKKAFTLAEMLIVLFVIGMLSTILIQSYLTMADMSFRIEQEKSISQEVLFVSEILQNFADRNSLDYSKYDLDELTKSDWITDVLYLTGVDGEIAIYSEWNCVDPWVEYKVADYLNDWIDPPLCWVEIEKNGEKILLSNQKKAYMSKAIFKIIPYASTDDYFSDNGDIICPYGERNYLSCPHHPWFWIIQKAYSRNFGLRWSSNVSVDVQQFFNLQ